MVFKRFLNNRFCMKKRLFILFFASVATQPAFAAFIGGSLSNTFPGDKLELQVPHYYYDGRRSSFTAVLDQNLQFGMEVQLPEPQLVFLTHNESRLPLFLAPDDTLLLRGDAFQFPLVLTYAGKAAANNRLLRHYFEQHPQDYNEFNNLRYKVGLYWANIEEPMNDRMLQLPPEAFKGYMDGQKTAAFALVDDFTAQNPTALSPAFSEWLASEIIYGWAYHLLFYGQVYANRHAVRPEFFDFLFEAPIISDQIGSEWYRQFLLLLLARQQIRASEGSTDGFWPGQYALAGELLGGKSLAFSRSELIRMSFSEERFREILPLFNHFLQTNTLPGYDEKVEELYLKLARSSPGTLAPDFNAPDATTGSAFQLSQLRGKVVYLNFWASWCAACLKKMEIFDGFEADLRAQGIAVVNVSIDEQPERWRAALIEGNFQGAQLLATEGRERNIAAAYGVEAVPQYFILTRSGAFAEKPRNAQPEDIRQKLIEISGKGQ
jgi:thiol-disulfide isomerase/thioredoxin